VSHTEEIEFLRSMGALLRRAGLDSPRSLLDHPRRVAVPTGFPFEGDVTARRRLFRLPPLPDGSIPFLVRFDRETAREAARAARAAHDRHRTLGLRGVSLSTPAALGCARVASGAAGFLLILVPAGGEFLDVLLRAGKIPDGSVDRKLAGMLSTLRAAGSGGCALYAWNVFVFPGGDVALLEAVEDARPGRGDGLLLGPQAALSATIDSRSLSRTARLRFLKRVLADEKSSSARGVWKTAWRKIDSRERRLRRRGIFPALFDTVVTGDSAGVLCAATAFRGDLAENGFVSAADFTDAPNRGARVLRDLPDRCNCIVESAAGRYFFKIHRERNRGRLLSQGEREWRSNLALGRFGLPTAPCAACGTSGDGPGFRSFFASRDAGGRPLDDILREREGEAGSFRRTLAVDAGRLVGLFHRAGFFHRDLYLCHLLLVNNRLCFIDLQRMEEGWIFRMHGRIKDLAALLYSSLPTPVSNADRLRFFRAYKGGGALTKKDRKLIAAVRRKARAIAAHDGRSGGEK
jgi:heptose I phosphotransferase